MRLRRWAVLSAAVTFAASCVRGHEDSGCGKYPSAFPPGVDERCAFTDDLVQLKEAPFWPPGPEAPEAFRLLVHEPIRLPLLVRAVRSPQGWDVVASASWGGNPAILRRTHSVLAEELEEVQHTLESGGFWKGAFKERPELELDPCIWLLEGTRAGNYSVAQVYEEPRSPQAKAVVAAAVKLLKIGGLESTRCGKVSVDDLGHQAPPQ